MGAIVQHQWTNHPGAGSGSDTFGSAVTSGNSVFVFVTPNGGAVGGCTCADDKSNTYDLVASPGAGSLAIYCFRATNVTNAPTVITYTFTSGTPDAGLTIIEGSGVSATLNDGTASATGTGTTADPTGITTTGSGLVFAQLNDGGTAYTTPGAPWTQIGYNGGSFYDTLEQVSAGIATFDPVWTLTSAPWVALVVAFGDAGSASASSTTTTVLQGSTGNVVPVVGVGTTWPGSGGTVWSVSGGTGAAVSAQTWTDGTHTGFTLAAGSATGVLTFSNNVDAATFTITVVAVSATSTTAAVNVGSTGNVIAVVGVGTAWPGAGGLTWSVSGGTGASLSAQTRTDGTHSGFTLNAGTTTGTLTFTNNVDAATFTISVTVLPNHPNLVYTPNTHRITAAVAVTNCVGSEIKFAFNGAGAVALRNDPTANQAAGVFPTLSWVLDGAGAWTDLTLTNTTSFTLATVGAGDHTLRVRFNYPGSTSADIWTTPGQGWWLTGITLPTGSTTIAPASWPSTLRKYTKKAILLGDSATWGVDDLANRPGQSHGAWPHATCEVLDAECGMIAFGGQRWDATGVMNVPSLDLSWPLYSAGHSRLTAGLMNDTVDYCFINMGSNGSVVPATVVSTLTAMRAAMPSAWIIVLIPFGQFQAANIATGVSDYKTANPSDAKVGQIDCGVPFSVGIDGTGASPDSGDGRHPHDWKHGQAGALVGAKALVLTGGGGGGGVIVTGGFLTG